MVLPGLFIVLVVIVVVVSVASDTGPLRKNRARFNRPSRSETNELGSGDLATKQQLARWFMKRERLGTSIPVHTVRASDGVAVKRGALVFPPDERNRHILFVAKTGSGKTTRAILPILYEDCLCSERSTIVIDSKPEMWDRLAGLTRRENPKKRIILFNPLDLTRSVSWNILSKIDSDTDAKLIANTIITATDNPSSRADSPFFRNSALQLLNSIMVGLLSDPAERLSMPRVHELVNAGIGALCSWLEAHPQALRNSKTFVDLARSGSQNADTIMSELAMRLAAWDLTSIRENTSFDELDLETLISEPTLFIVELRESELEMLRPMANVIVVEILRFLTKRAEQLPGQTLPRPVSIVIDEFASSLGRLPDIHIKLNTLRSRNVSVVAAIQSIAQIKANYDKDADSVLAGFSSKIFMPSLDFQDAEWASKETGTMTVRFNVASIGKNRRLIDFFANRNQNLQEQVQQRAVLTADEIGRPSDNAATFFLPNTPVFQGHLIPYFEVPEMALRFEQGMGAPIQFKEGIKPRVVHVVPPPVVNELERRKAAVGLPRASEGARRWFADIEQKNIGKTEGIEALLRAAEERALSLDDLWRAYEASGLGHGDKSLAAIEATLDGFVLEKLRIALGVESASSPARQWWNAFEAANQGQSGMVRELMHQLARRKVSIDDVFQVYVHLECHELSELLRGLDRLIEHRESNNSRGRREARHAAVG